VVESLFVHVTVVPTVTVSGVGLKAKFLMLTELPVPVLLLPPLDGLCLARIATAAMATTMITTTMAIVTDLRSMVESASQKYYRLCRSGDI
jgi:hypothetical protein